MHPDFPKIKEKALRLLARRDHSTLELRRKLGQKYNFDNETFSELLKYLHNLGYIIDEKSLAGRWAEQWRNQGRGRHWIAAKLKEKGLPSVEISDDQEELEAAKEFLIKKLAGRTLRSLDYKDKARVARSLIGRGFSPSVVANIIGNREPID